MEIGALATKDNAEEGVWIQAELYGKKQMFDIKILGADSDDVQKYIRNSARKLRASGGDVKEMDDETFDELIDSADDNVICRVAGLRSRDSSPLTLDGVELGCNEKSYRLLIEKIPAIKDFILKKSNERSNFLSKGKRD